jgi:tripeptidyl-peptidase II
MAVHWVSELQHLHLSHAIFKPENGLQPLPCHPCWCAVSLASVSASASMIAFSYLSPSSTRIPSRFAQSAAVLLRQLKASAPSRISFTAASSDMPAKGHAGSPTSGPQKGSTRFAGAMPKEDIGAATFLKKHPEFDGRNCVIAIFDTGVDPAAAGLAKTPEGLPKILDLVDGTGSGDVDMSKEVEAEAFGVLQGLHGMKLLVNSSWSNPTGKWRVGAKPLFELYPSKCKTFVREKRKVWPMRHPWALQDKLHK